MTYNTSALVEAAIRELMREHRIDRETAIQIYLKERRESLK